MAAEKKALEEDLPVIEAKLKEHQSVSACSKCGLFMKIVENFIFTWIFFQEYKKKLLERRKLGLRRLKPTGPTPKEMIESYTGPSLNIILKGRNSLILTRVSKSCS